jgi:beta-galactosidase GanA
MRATSTPYLDELKRVYDGSLYLDANTTLITESQILKGKASQYKVILVPAVKHVPPEVAQALLQYVTEGGHLIIAPESFMTDQYLRPLDFFDKVGVRILKTSATAGYSMGAAQQQYDQTWRQSATLSGIVTREITTLPCDEFGTAPLKLHARGIVQTLEVGKGSTELARFTDGGPAIIGHPHGRGKVYTLAMPLDPQSYAQVFDSLFQHASISRPVRFTDPAGQRIWQLEARSLREGHDWLISMINHGETKVIVKVDWPAESRSMKDLRGGESIAPDGVVALAPRETRLLRVE